MLASNWSHRASFASRFAKWATWRRDDMWNQAKKQSAAAAWEICHPYFVSCVTSLCFCPGVLSGFVVLNPNAATHLHTRLIDAGINSLEKMSVNMVCIILYHCLYQPCGLGFACEVLPNMGTELKGLCVQCVMFVWVQPFQKTLLYGVLKTVDKRTWEPTNKKDLKGKNFRKFCVSKPSRGMCLGQSQLCIDIQARLTIFFTCFY